MAWLADELVLDHWDRVPKNKALIPVRAPIGSRAFDPTTCRSWVSSTWSAFMGRAAYDLHLPWLDSRGRANDAPSTFWNWNLETRIYGNFPIKPALGHDRLERSRRPL